MARPNAPWYRASKNTWYSTVDGKKVSLGVKGRNNEAEAIKAWHKLMANGKPSSKPKAEAAGVGEVLTAFLADCEGRVKPNTLRCYKLFLLPFARTHKGKAEDLTPTQAEAYSRKPQWSDATRASFLGALIVAFRWAVRTRLLTINPLQGVRVPTKPSRGDKTLISDDEYERLVSHASPTFGMVLRVLWATGCRPGEATAITAENFDSANGTVRLRQHKTAHKGKSRVLYLPPKITALLSQLAKRYPQGPLLRTCWGNAWEKSKLVREMISLRKRAGVPHATLYGFRHSFATQALAVGVPEAQVAALLGHSGTAMLHKHYSHLGARAKALRDALDRVR
jgi:integrase